MFISALTHLSSDLFLFSEKKIMQLFVCCFYFVDLHLMRETFRVIVFAAFWITGMWITLFD